MALSNLSCPFPENHDAQQSDSNSWLDPTSQETDIFLISSGKNQKIKMLIKTLKQHDHNYYLLDHPPQAPGIILLDCTTTSPTPRMIDCRKTMVIAITDTNSSINHTELSNVFDTLHCRSHELIIANRIKLYLNYYKTLKQPQLLEPQLSMSRSQHLVYKACAILEKNLSEAVCTRNLCKMLYTNHNTLYKAFKAQLGMGVHQWLMRRRIEEATRLLVETELPIQHIAFDIGFSRQSSFSTFFKAEKGVTPSAYRKSARHTHVMKYSSVHS